MALLGLALDLGAQAFGGAIGGGGQAAIATPLQQADDLVGQAVGAQAGDSHLAAGVDERPKDGDQLAGDR